MNPAYIYDAIRTPRGRAKANGSLADLTPLQLLQALYNALQQRTALNAAHVDDVILGCVTQSGEQAGNVAKASLMYSAWPDTVPGLTLNRYCSSGLDAVNFASMKIQTGQARIAIGGGVEMMSRVPMMSDKASIFIDTELSARCRMLMMGNGADLIASLGNISREQVDAVALQSQQRASLARYEGRYRSIIPIDNPVKKMTVREDECIRPETTLASLAAMEPAFAQLGAQGINALQLGEHTGLGNINHVHTAGNSPAMADAAALVLLADRAYGQRNEMQPRAEIVAATTVCEDPLEVVSGCALATKKLMAQQRITEREVDLFELHEAFAATSIKCRNELGIDDSKMNVNGGAISLGHPMGATGAIMLGTLLDELERQDLNSGIVAASGAAGTGTAMLIRRS